VSLTPPPLDARSATVDPLQGSTWRGEFGERLGAAAAAAAAHAAKESAEAEAAACAKAADLDACEAYPADHPSGVGALLAQAVYPDPEKDEASGIARLIDFLRA
jgi:hypothetical protein